MRKLIILVSVLFVSLLAYSANVNELRTELLKNPEGIGTTTPKFSWIIESNERNVEQKAYQILVASSLEKLNEKDADLWNSGKVASRESTKVQYAGTPLDSRSQAFWKVRVYTNKADSVWSAPAKFSVGFLKNTDWSAQWIGLDKLFPWDSDAHKARLSARYLRKEFTSKKEIKSAKVYISGLGLYELYINGKKIGDQVLAPGPTDYFKTVLYNTFDVTEYIKKGKMP